MDTQCPFCHSASKEYWQPSDICKCSSCHLLFRHPLPSSDDLRGLYERSWNDPDIHTSQTGNLSLYLARIFGQKLAVSLRLNNFYDHNPSACFLNSRQLGVNKSICWYIQKLLHNFDTCIQLEESIFSYSRYSFSFFSSSAGMNISYNLKVVIHPSI